MQHREVQENESRLFLSYFDGQHITYLAGGAASGFKHVEAEQREVRMLQVKGRAGNILLTEVALTRSSMNSGDVFIVDTQVRRGRACPPCATLTLTLTQTQGKKP